jgi:hypothetical protein
LFGIIEAALCLTKVVPMPREVMLKLVRCRSFDWTIYDTGDPYKPDPTAERAVRIPGEELGQRAPWLPLLDC